MTKLMSPSVSLRRLPVGAEVLSSGGTHFRVWAKRCQQVAVRVVDEHNNVLDRIVLEPEEGGYFSGSAAGVSAGDLYWMELDGGSPGFADPASRYQPKGPLGPSQVVDPRDFAWTDSGWTGARLVNQVMYEMHIGTFTRDGKWQAAAEQLPELADLGITMLELMPVADFPGRFGWGYDGVNLFAPTRLYGDPDAFRSFVDRAHALGIAVILDVVYNHLGPDGNHLSEFAEDYFSKGKPTDWGSAINFDGQNCGPVREFFLANVTYWIDEFHLDGLRLDATQDIQDRSPDHILAAISRAAREAAAGRSIVLVAENEPQESKLARPSARGGYGLDGMWNDDFHHSATVLLSGRNEAYYSDYRGRPQEFISAIKRGFLYQGQWYSWQNKLRGRPSMDLEPASFIHFIQNHDQIANTAQGQRAHTWTSPGRFRAMTALLLLGPQTPMLFQGQEFAASSPFFYFADHKPELATLVEAGRKEFMKQFPSIARPEVQARLPDPGDPQTFVRSKLDTAERQTHAEAYAVYRDLLRLRREDPVFGNPRAGGVDGAVLGDGAFVLRFFGEQGDDRLLLVNFDPDLHLEPMPEPLLAPPENKAWKIIWSSEDVRYGGSGTPPVGDDEPWVLPGQAAIALGPTDKSPSAPDGDGGSHWRNGDETAGANHR